MLPLPRLLEKPIFSDRVHTILTNRDYNEIGRVKHLLHRPISAEQLYHGIRIKKIPLTIHRAVSSDTQPHPLPT